MYFLIEAISLVMIFFMTLFIATKIQVSSTASINKNQTIAAYGIVILIHTIVSIWNGFYGPIYGATNDALEFHRAAVLYFDENSSADLLIPGWVYSIFLAIVYEATNQSWAIGCLLSTLFFGLLCVASVNLYNTLVFHKNLSCSKSNMAPAMIILLIGLIPSSIILTSITMREVFQMLFLCLTLIYSIKYSKTKSYKYLVFTVMTLVLFASLHSSFWYYLVVYLMAFLCFQFRHILHVRKPFVVLGLFFGLLCFLFIADVDPLYATISKFIDGANQADSGSARAYYGLPEVGSNIFSILGFIVVSFFHYMTRPFLWEMTSVIDITAIVENVMRLFFIWRVFVLREYLSASIVWVLCAAFFMEILWGMGTLNWGTAQRHHLVAWPLFVISYFAVLTRYKASHARATSSNLSVHAI